MDEREEMFMSLLLESKRAWLLSYSLVTLLTMGLYFGAADSLVCKIAWILVGEMQALMALFFLLILIFRWRTLCRTFLAISFLGITIYFGINHLISKWYVIIPLSLVLLFYMLWNIGGVVNCVVANKYKKKLDKAVLECKQSYNDYKGKVGEYNTRNELGFWTKIRTKREPNWGTLGFDSSALGMFALDKAIPGISTLEWENNLLKMREINARLSDKHDALDNNSSLLEEREIIGRIKHNSVKIGERTDIFSNQEQTLDKKIKRNRKQERKILKRRL